MEASALPDAGIEDRDKKSKTRRPFGAANQPKVGAEAEAEEHVCFLVPTLGMRSLARTLRLTNVSDVQLAYHRRPRLERIALLALCYVAAVDGYGSFCNARDLVTLAVHIYCSQGMAVVEDGES